MMEETHSAEQNDLRDRLSVNEAELSRLKQQVFD